LENKKDKLSSLSEKLKQIEQIGNQSSNETVFAIDEVQKLLSAIPFPILIFDKKFQKHYSNLMFNETFQSAESFFESVESEEKNNFLDKISKIFINKESDIYHYKLSILEDEFYVKIYLNYLHFPKCELIMALFLDLTDFVKQEELTQKHIEDLQYSREVIEENALKIIQLNNDLEISQNELQKAIQQRDKFLSIVAHDLRSPFTALLGYSEILKEEATTLSQEELVDYTNHLYNSITAYYKLVENLLTWSRVQRGKIEIKKEYFNLFDVIYNIFESVESNARMKGNHLTTNVRKGEMIYADQMMIETVIRNLISNSIKFTKNGLISVNFEKFDVGIQICVQDNGIGMNEKTLSQLFSLDANISHNGTDGEKGTGLGLLVSKEFVEMHNGKFMVTSQENVGSTFCFTIL